MAARTLLGRASLAPALAVALALLLGAPRAAVAQLRTCVRVDAPERETEPLARLVRGEIDRHPTHRAAAPAPTGAAADGCQAHLTVELLDLGAVEGRWLTGRINTEIPHRERIGPDGLVRAVERLLTLVLKNDPYVLRDPDAGSWLRRQRRALEVRSRTRFGVEVFEVGARVGQSVGTLPGMALVLRRDVSEFFIGVRVGGAFAFGAPPDGLRLRAKIDAQIEAALYARPAADVSLFAGALLGVAYQRFQGPAPLDGPGATGEAVSAGVSVALRGGVEVLRTSNVRALAFLMLEVPAFNSRDEDHGVVDQWIPSATVGVGVLF